MGDTVLGTRGETDALSSLPRIEQVAGELRIPEERLRVAFQNHRINLNHSDRVPWELVAWVLEAELQAGRPVATDPTMVPVSVSRTTP